MPTFDYKGRNSRGELMAGRIDSPNSQAVAIWMTAVGITPVAITRMAVPGAQPKWMRDLFGQNKLAEVELLLFTRQMGALVKAGVPMMQALAGIQKSSQKEHVVDTLQAIRDDLDKGMELSGALARHPKSFSEFYVNMVRIGESSGQLEAIFRRLHEQLEFDLLMRQKLKGALRYPTFVLIALAIAMGILNIYVIPVFAGVYAGMKVSLPLVTRVLIAISNATVNYWWVILALVILAIFAYRVYTATPEGRYRVDRLKLRIPLFGSVIAKTTMARYAFSFATASESGVPLVQNYTMASRVVNNSFYEQRIVQMRDGVERGESMHRVAQSSGIFTPIELQMIAVGEETGHVDEMLRQIAKMYQAEVDFEVSRLTQSLEPILIGAMGAMVAIVMLGIFLPLWDLGQLARKR